MSLTLARTPARPPELIGTLPGGMTAAEAHAQLAHFAAGVLGPGWERLFAAPHDEGGVTLWSVEGERSSPYLGLPAGERAAVRASLGRAVSALRRAAERDVPPLLPLLAAALEIPSWDAVHVVDGVPVLAPWGLRPEARAPGQGPITALDDGRPARPAPFVPLAPVLATLAALALLALAAVWLTPRFAPYLDASVACRADPAQIAALSALLAEEGREQGLAADLSALETELARKRLACPIARIPPPPPPQPPREARAPPPPPPQRPPDAKPCDEETQSGGRGITRTRHYLGPNPGRVTLRYDTLIEPDHIEVLYRGRQLATTWIPVSGRGTLSFDWRPSGTGPEAHTVEVIVTGFGLSTRWRYTLGCPR
ncbi:hypothetical protein [Elioraea thermophila]|uniref:hypothetical protein n=1 Tax=Elioraea thermophila TaxID=2185104 RepID=UPI000DF2D8E0|nr:hypothetical protein [Elioraea thermophila]